MSNLANDINDLKKYLAEQRKNGMLGKKSYEQLLKRLQEDTESFDKNSKQLASNQKIVKEVASATKSFITNSLRGAQAIRKNREDFRSLGPSLKAASGAAQLASSTVGKVFQAVGDAASTFSIFGGPVTKLLGTIGGGALSALGNVLDTGAKEAAKLANAFGQFALGELQNVVDSYRTLGSVGGITAKGMNGVYDDAIRAGMGIKEYSQLVADQGQNFSAFAGSVTAGAEALGKVSQANEGYKQEYLKLGYTYAEQQKYTGEYLKRNRLLQGNSIEDTNKLSEGSLEYMDLLDEISRLTGQSRDEAAKELDEQQSNVRFQAAMRIATKKSGDTKIANNMSKMSSVIKEMGGRGLAEGFQDLMSGMSTKAGVAFDQATGGEGQKIAEMVKRGEIDANQGLEMVQKAARRQQEQVGKDTFAVRVGNTNAVLADILPEQTKLVNAQDLTVEGLQQAKKDQQQAKKSKDKETENLVKAQDAMRKMAMDFDRIVQKKVFPLATEAVDEFTDLVVEFVNKSGSALGFVNKVVRKEKVPAAGAAPVGPPEGQPQPGAAPEGPPGEGLTGKSLSGVNPKLKAAIEKVASAYKASTGKTVNVTSAVRTPEEQAKLYADYQAGKSKYPVAPPGRSKHDRGLAIDVDSKIANELDSMGLLAKYGLGRPVANDPVHIEVVSAATGGVFSGPKSGFPAVLHGNEAVVPLPNGTDIPMQPTGLSETTSQQIDSIKRQTQIINDLIAAARSNNDANKRLLSLKTS